MNNSSIGFMRVFAKIDGDRVSILFSTIPLKDSNKENRR